MSESYGDIPSGGPTGDSTGTVESAKQEARDLAGTAREDAGHVVDAARSEAGAVASEAKNQAKDLYRQTRSELEEQAAAQQKRVADGLHSVGAELESMARSSDDPGLAAELVQQASTRISGVAGWLSDRDPGSLVSEVKGYAQRHPGTFIAVAALAGLAAGRLTRALAEDASGPDSASRTPTSAAPSATAEAPPAPGVAPGVGATPVYEQSRAAWAQTQGTERSTDVGSDPV
jgi:vacuolar-type H+-ATPase subunit H